MSKIINSVAKDTENHVPCLLYTSFVYGLAHDTDIVSDVAGNITFAMYRICIQNIDGEIAKEYQKDGVYVTAVKRKEGLLELERATRTGGGFTPADSDHIMNNIQNTEETRCV